MANNKKTSFELSQDAIELIKQLEKRLALLKKQVIELAIRELAKKWGIPVPPEKDTPKSVNDSEQNQGG
jgi:uncharacterized small protein (DUF1192 family)